MSEPRAAARAALVENVHWEKALERALEQTAGIFPDLAVLFASAAFAEHFGALVRRARNESGAGVLVGCSGQGVIGVGREAEHEPAIALLTLRLPGALLRAARFTQTWLEDASAPEAWPERLGVPTADAGGWLVFAEPFRMDCERLVHGLGAAYRGAPIVGGLASATRSENKAWVFLDDEAHDEGGVGLAIGGAYGLAPLVSQGCEPIGEAWTITGARGNLVETISGRPAYEVLVETFEALAPDRKERARSNLLVGLAADERRDQYGRGDFLIRNLIGVDRRTGALAISALPRVGQTIQFQLRDATAADADLSGLLAAARERHAGAAPVAGVLCSCNGRGAGMFGAPHHDAAAVAAALGDLPLAGLFCNGEIGPVGARPFLHGFTASLGLIVRRTGEVPFP